MPALEVAVGKKFDEIPAAQRPTLGLVLGGFSANAFLSELWQIYIPHYDQPRSAIQARAQPSIGTNWSAMFEPIRRHVKGYDQALVPPFRAARQS